MPYPWRWPSSVFHHPSSVSTITTRNNKAVKSIFCANVYHVPGLCLLGIGGAPTSVIKLWLENNIFKFSTSVKQPAGGASYYARRLPKPRPLQFVQIMVKHHLEAFWQNFKYGKMQNLVSVYNTINVKNILLKIIFYKTLLNRILRYCTVIVLGYV